MIILELDPYEIGWETVNKIMALLEGSDLPLPPPPPPLPDHSIIRIAETHARKEIVGHNKKGFPIMGNLKGQRAEVGEVYWCDVFSIKADGGLHYWRIQARHSPDPSTVMADQYLDARKVVAL